MNDRLGGLTAALDQIRGVDIDDAAVRAHVMWPDYLREVTSDRGPEGVPVERLLRPPPPRPEYYSLDVAGFIQALEEQLTGSVAGYWIRLTENGFPFADADQNWAKQPQDGGQNWTPDTRMHVASLSKIVTAIAMTRLLGEAGIPPSTPIIDYLPGYWVKGPNVDQITFADLLTHRSGLAWQTTNSRSDFEWMKSQIALGTMNIGRFNYQNMNFGLCRILLATINGNIPVDWILTGLLGEFTDIYWDLITIRAYASYVAGQVFAPASVTGPDFTHDAADALAYNFPVTGNGWNSGDLTSMAGGAAWHMSVDEVLKVMATFRRSGTIVSTAQAQAMLDDGFGIDWSVATPLGSYYAKNGIWTDSSGHREQGVAFFLPGDMELVVLVNSPVGDGPMGQFLYTVVSDAYTANIVETTPPVKLAPDIKAAVAVDSDSRGQPDTPASS